VWGEDVATGRRTVTLNSHLVFVHVDEDAKPQPIRARIEPRDGLGMLRRGRYRTLRGSR